MVDTLTQEILKARQFKISTNVASDLLLIIDRLVSQEKQLRAMLQKKKEEEEGEEECPTISELRPQDFGAAEFKRAERFLTIHLAFSLNLHDRMVHHGVFKDYLTFTTALIAENQRDPALMEELKTLSKHVTKSGVNHSILMGQWIERAHKPTKGHMNNFASLGVSVGRVYPASIKSYILLILHPLICTHMESIKRASIFFLLHHLFPSPMPRGTTFSYPKKGQKPKGSVYELRAPYTFSRELRAEFT